MEKIVDLGAERARRAGRVKLAEEMTDEEWEAIPIPDDHRRVSREYATRLRKQGERRDAAFALGLPFDEPWEEE